MRWGKKRPAKESERKEQQLKCAYTSSSKRVEMTHQFTRASCSCPGDTP